MAESGGNTVGRESSQGPGWWLASDGKWYPPDLSPGKPARKKKRRAPRTDDASGPDASTQASGKARASSTHRGGRTASSPAGDEPRPDTADDGSAERRGETQDQIAARRAQAREQNALLAGARQQAALRALTSLGVDAEPELVGAGARTFDAARRGRTRPKRGTSSAKSAPTTTEDDEPTTVEPDAGIEAEREREHETATPEPEAQAQAEAEAEAEPETAAPQAETATPDAEHEIATPEPETAMPDAEAEPEPVPTPHRPTKRPEPVGAPMGTEAPFMEVRGSALGTDIERIGEKILIFADRVELRDRGNSVKQTITYDQLGTVDTPKKIMGPSLVVTSVDGDEMVAKALRPELATGAKAMIEKHARRHVGDEETPPEPAPAEASSPEPEPAPPPEPEPAVGAVALPPPVAPERMPARHVLAAMIDELHLAGLLTDDERAAKLQRLEEIGHD